MHDEHALGRVLFQLLTEKNPRFFPIAEKYQLRKWEHSGKYLSLQQEFKRTKQHRDGIVLKGSTDIKSKARSQE